MSTITLGSQANRKKTDTNTDLQKFCQNDGIKTGRILDMQATVFARSDLQAFKLLRNCYPKFTISAHAMQIVCPTGIA